MATSEVAIANSALIKISEDTIISFEDDRRAARLCKTQYPIKRDELLGRSRWKFAIQRFTLAAESPGPEFGFTNKFMFPADAISFVGMYDRNEPSINYTSTDVPHVIEGRFVLTDDTVLNGFFIVRVTNVELFHPTFAEALAHLLAKDLAYALTSGREMIDKMDAGFKDAMLVARQANAIQGPAEIPQISTWVDAHSGSRGPFRQSNSV